MVDGVTTVSVIVGKVTVGATTDVNACCCIGTGDCASSNCGVFGRDKYTGEGRCCVDNTL